MTSTPLLFYAVLILGLACGSEVFASAPSPGSPPASPAPVEKRLSKKDIQKYAAMFSMDVGGTPEFWVKRIKQDPNWARELHSCLTNPACAVQFKNAAREPLEDAKKRQGEGSSGQAPDVVMDLYGATVLALDKVRSAGGEAGAHILDQAYAGAGSAGGAVNAVPGQRLPGSKRPAGAKPGARPGAQGTPPPAPPSSESLVPASKLHKTYAHSSEGGISEHVKVGKQPLAIWIRTDEKGKNYLVVSGLRDYDKNGIFDDEIALEPKESGQRVKGVLNPKGGWFSRRYSVEVDGNDVYVNAGRGDAKGKGSEKVSLSRLFENRRKRAKDPKERSELKAGHHKVYLVPQEGPKPSYLVWEAKIVDRENYKRAQSLTPWGAFPAPLSESDTVSIHGKKYKLVYDNDKEEYSLKEAEEKHDHPAPAAATAASGGGSGSSGGQSMDQSRVTGSNLTWAMVVNQGNIFEAGSEMGRLQADSEDIKSDSILYHNDKKDKWYIIVKLSVPGKDPLGSVPTLLKGMSKKPEKYALKGNFSLKEDQLNSLLVCQDEPHKAYMLVESKGGTSCPAKNEVLAPKDGFIGHILWEGDKEPGTH